MATNIPYGSPLAAKKYSVGLFHKMTQTPGFLNLLSGAMPTDGSFASKAKGQTSPDYPVVKAGDLSKGAGDAVSVDLFNILQGKPVMGDKRIEGKMMQLTTSSMDIRIDQTRGGADSGGRMTQKRTEHNLRLVATAGLAGWAGRLSDQRTLVHLAGARGSQSTADWVIPYAADSDFQSIMINRVNAPTKNRQYYANDATSVADLGTNDALTFQDIERIVSVLRESSAPLQQIKIQGDDRAWNDPLWAMFLTERQWLYLKSRTSQTQWRDAVKNAFERKSSGVKHPLFDAYETIMWDGMLIKRLNRMAIRFKANDSVVVDSGGADGGTYTETATTAAVDTDRAIIVGAQALGLAYGQDAKSGYFCNWSEKLVDHDNAVEIVGGLMDGAAKIRFKIDGVDTDHGVAVIDSYAPDPNSTAGRTLLAS